MNRKNHFFKRVFAVLMVVILTVSAVPLSGFVGLELPKWSEMFATKASAAITFTEGNLKYEIENGEATITGHTSSISGALVIPNTLGGYPVKSIGDFAFNDCTDLTSVTIGNSVTSIGEWAFDGCTGLISITIPDSVTSIGGSAFKGCTGLIKINWNAESVSDFSEYGKVFYNAGTSGSGIDVVFGDSVKRIPTYAFYVSDSSYRPKIKSVTIGNSVTSIGDYAFYCCTGLTSVTIGNSVTSIGGSAFYNTAWYNAQPFGDVYAGKVYYKYKGTMPENTIIVIKDGTKGIADSAFHNCTGLTSVTIPNSVTSIGDSAFNSCRCLKDIIIPNSVASIGDSVFNSCRRLKDIIIPNSVASIGSSAFRSCTGLASITIPDSVTSIGDYAFRDCTGLTSVTIGNSVTSIGGSAFRGCTGLTSMTIPDSVTSIGYEAFYNCTGLTSITIPDSVTSIDDYAFYNCTGLTKINWNAESVSDFSESSRVFYNTGTSGSGINVVFGDNVKRIPTYAFYVSDSSYRPKIKSVTIGNSVTSIGDYAFYYCTGLTSVIIPDSVTSIGYRAFYKCTGLKSITIGNGAETISEDAFKGCPLTIIKIGKNVKTIEKNAFYGIKSIPEIYYAGSESDWKNIAIDQSNDMVLRATMYYNIDITHTHSYIETITNPATCTENGTKTFTCDCGKIYTEEIPTTGHTPSDWIVDSEATCTNAGSKHKECTVCKTKLETATVPAIGHKSSSWITDKAATCVNDGSKHKECTVCKTKLETVAISATGHSFKTTTVAATCTSIGYVTKTCSKCEETQFVKSIPATGHTPGEWIVDKEATCTNVGSKHKECTICKTVLETEELVATGHSFKNEVTASTCTSIGYETKTCQNCGECQFVRSITATGHTPSDWIVDSEATCTNVGSKHKECSVCKEKLETAIIPTTSHNFKTETTEATCTSIGYVTKICQNCGECQFVKGIPAKGHSVKTVSVPATFTESGLSIASCKTCGTITKATLIKRIASVSLAKTAYVYNGKAQTPSVVVKDSAGKTLKLNTDYVVKYASGRKNPGIYSVVVTFKGFYSGSKALSFTITPQAPTLTATAGAKKATLKWNKQTGATGYVVYMATTKSGKYTKATTLKGNSKVSFTKTGLTKGKTYYFKVCAYTTVGGKTVYGAASAVKAVKVK